MPQEKVHASKSKRVFPAGSADYDDDKQHSVTQHVTFFTGATAGVLLQSGQQELEDEVWQRLFAVGKQFQRAGYCAGHCQGQGMIIGRQGRCAIVQWDANSNGQWDSTASENDSTGFRRVRIA